MINPYFTFTTDNKNLCCYKTSAILYISFYTDPNEKYKMQIQKIIGRSKDYENLQSKRLQGHEQKGS